MKITIQAITAALMIVSCAACASTETIESGHSEAKKSHHFEDSIHSSYPTGDISIEDLKQHSKFFSHHDAVPNAEQVKLLKSIESPITITTYFGLWCHDSQREVPQLIDLLAEAKNDNITHNLIALSIKKTEPKNRQDADNVLYTPTMIIKIDGDEVGRIIETPNKSLAQDIVDAVKQHNP